MSVAPRSHSPCTAETTEPAVSVPTFAAQKFAAVPAPELEPPVLSTLSESAGGVDPGPTHGARVLVADDNESVADSLAFLLDCHGHHAAVAYDGETALRLLRTGTFGIVFLDENLPDIKGSAVARSLRETPIRSGAFLVSMTGDADSQADIARLFDVYLQKPFSLKQLARAVQALMTTPIRT